MKVDGGIIENVDIIDQKIKQTEIGGGLGINPESQAQSKSPGSQPPLYGPLGQRGIPKVRDSKLNTSTPLSQLDWVSLQRPISPKLHQEMKSDLLNKQKLTKSVLRKLKKSIKL